MFLNRCLHHLDGAVRGNFSVHTTAAEISYNSNGCLHRLVGAVRCNFLVITTAGGVSYNTSYTQKTCLRAKWVSAYFTLFTLRSIIVMRIWLFTCSCCFLAIKHFYVSKDVKSSLRFPVSKTAIRSLTYLNRCPNTCLCELLTYEFLYVCVQFFLLSGGYIPFAFFVQSR